MSFLYAEILYLELAIIVLFGVLFSHKNPKFAIFGEGVLERLKEKNTYKQELRLILLFLALSGIVAALARPVLKAQVVQERRLVLLLDASKSMMAINEDKSRFALAQEQIEYILSHNKENALAIFTKDCFIASSFTQDSKSLRALLRRTNPYNMPSFGTDLASALECLGEFFGKSELVLFSDGNEQDIDSAPKIAQKYGLRIHTMRFNPKPSRIPNEEDAPLSTSVDLTKLSDATAGQSFQSAHELLERLNKKQTKIRKELFVYPLAFAIFALIFAFFSAPSFLILLAFIPAPSEAFSLDFASEARARQFYKEQKYQDAIREYSSIKGASKAQQARIFYNIANAHFMLKNYDAAAQFYKRSLQYGDLKQARKNLALLHDKPRSKEEKIATKYQKHKVQIKDSPFFLEPSKRGKSANSW